MLDNRTQVSRELFWRTNELFRQVCSMLDSFGSIIAQVPKIRSGISCELHVLVSMDPGEPGTDLFVSVGTDTPAHSQKGDSIGLMRS
jgi:hypothetical protein